MNTLLAFSFVVMALVQLVAYVLILQRHAVPNAPTRFHWAITPPMVLSVVAAFALAVMAEGGLEGLLGLTLEAWRFSLVWCINGYLGVLIFYSWSWYRRGRNGR